MKKRHEKGLKNIELTHILTNKSEKHGERIKTTGIGRLAKTYK